MAMESEKTIKPLLDKWGNHLISKNGFIVLRIEFIRQLSFELLVKRTILTRDGSSH